MISNKKIFLLMVFSVAISFFGMNSSFEEEVETAYNLYAASGYPSGGLTETSYSASFSTGIIGSPRSTEIPGAAAPRDGSSSSSSDKLQRGSPTGGSSALPTDDDAAGDEQYSGCSQAQHGQIGGSTPSGDISDQGREGSESDGDSSTRGASAPAASNPSASGAHPTGAADGNRIVQEAEKYLGQGNTNGKFGSDPSGWCLDFVLKVLEDADIQPPWNGTQSADGLDAIIKWAGDSRKVDPANAMPGDILVRYIEGDLVTSHVCIVKEKTGDQIHTIDGNWGGEGESSVVGENTLSVQELQGSSEYTLVRI